MLEAETPRRRTTFWTPVRKTWTLILLGFAIFCLITGSAANTVMRAVYTPLHPTLRVSVRQPESILIRPAGLTQANQVVQSDYLNVGDTLITAEKAVPGVVGVIELAPGTIAAWGNTQLVVEQRRAASMPSRLKLRRGQIVVDLPSSDEPLEIDLPDGLVKLAAPGYYRLRNLAADTLTTATAERSSIPDSEVAVAEGEAVIGDTRVLPGARFLLGKANRGFTENAWSLLRDGKFRDFSSDDYNRTMVPDPNLSSADTWQVTVGSPVYADPNAQFGQFFVEQECPNGNADRGQCRNAAHFLRKGNNEQGAITAITQDISADVVSYDQVALNAAVRVRMQSLSKTGVLGTECPVLIRVYYTNDPSNNEHESDYCFWAYEYPKQKSTVSSLPWIKTIQVPQDSWYNFSVDLKRQIPNLLSILKIEVHADGHDYDTEVADVSLGGINLSRQPLPAVAMPAGHADGNVLP